MGGKTFSFPGGLSPHLAVHGVGMEKDDLHFDMNTKVGDKTIDDWMNEMGAKMSAIEVEVSTILEAIALNHQKGPDGKCIQDCWSCRVIETMEGIRVSNRISGG
jgi:hypothetical protein